MCVFRTLGEKTPLCQMPLLATIRAAPSDRLRGSFSFMNPVRLSLVEKFAGVGIKFTDGRAVEIIDLRIIYEKGAPIAYVRPLTIQGRRWLWNHVKYPYAGSNAIVDAEQLLELLQRMDADELTIHWQS
jgi:hypothetical protein